MIELVYPPDATVQVIPAATSQTSHRKRKGNVAAMLPVVQEDGLVVAMSDVDYCHGGSRLLHPAVHLHVMDRNGRIFLRRSAQRQNSCPGLWNMAVEGHVLYGETVMEAILREAADGIGLGDFNPVAIGSYIHDSDKCRELVCVFAALGHFDFNPGLDKQVDGRWVDLKEFEKNAGKGVFSPVLVSEYRRVRKQLVSLL